MKQPLVTIAIPCYNYGRYLGEAIQSALSQTYPNIQITVVDDGSTDNSKEIAKKFGKKIEYVYQKNQGLSAARNTGAKHANGDYIVFLDADDIIEPDYISSCLEIIQSDPAVSYVYTQMKLFGRMGGQTNYPEFNPRTLIYGNYIHATALIKTSLVRKFPYDTNLKTAWEDFDFYLTLAENGYYGKLLDRPLLRYRKHDSMVDKIDTTKEKRLLLQIMDRHPSLLRPWSKLYVHLLYFVRYSKLLSVPAKGIKRLWLRLPR